MSSKNDEAIVKDVCTRSTCQKGVHVLCSPAEHHSLDRFNTIVEIVELEAQRTRWGCGSIEAARVHRGNESSRASASTFPAWCSSGIVCHAALYVELRNAAWSGTRDGRKKGNLLAQMSCGLEARWGTCAALHRPAPCGTWPPPPRPHCSILKSWVSSDSWEIMSMWWTVADYKISVRFSEIKLMDANIPNFAKVTPLYGTYSMFLSPRDPVPAANLTSQPWTSTLSSTNVASYGTLRPTRWPWLAVWCAGGAPGGRVGRRADECRAGQPELVLQTWVWAGVDHHEAAEASWGSCCAAAAAAAAGRRSEAGSDGADRRRCGRSEAVWSVLLLAAPGQPRVRHEGEPRPAPATSTVADRCSPCAIAQ